MGCLGRNKHKIHELAKKNSSTDKTFYSIDPISLVHSLDRESMTNGGNLPVLSLSTPSVETRQERRFFLLHPLKASGQFCNLVPRSFLNPVQFPSFQAFPADAQISFWKGKMVELKKNQICFVQKTRVTSQLTSQLVIETVS